MLGIITHSRVMERIRNYHILKIINTRVHIIYVNQGQSSSLSTKAYQASFWISLILNYVTGEGIKRAFCLSYTPCTIQKKIWNMKWFIDFS